MVQLTSKFTTRVVFSHVLFDIIRDSSQNLCATRSERIAREGLVYASLHHVWESSRVSLREVQIEVTIRDLSCNDHTYGRNQKRKRFVIVLRTILQYLVVKLKCVSLKITNGTTVNYKWCYAKLQMVLQ